MNTRTAMGPNAHMRAPLAIAAAIVAVGVFGLLATGAEGARLFLALVETGLASCF